MCRGVGPSGLPIDRSMMSSPRRRAAIFSSLVMLKTYGGRRWILANSRIVDRILAVKLQASAVSRLNAFTGYGEGYVQVNGQRREASVLVTPEQVLDWAPASFAELAEAHFARIV